MPATIDTPRSTGLRGAPLDSWIALSADETRILASGATYEEASKQLDEVGRMDPRADVENAIIIKTPESWLRLAV